VSPHLDDAVLSCALHLVGHPGSHVVTVFAGGPARVAPLTSWDASTGQLHEGDDVVALRRAEDAAAARRVGAQVHHLDFWDEQYRIPGYGYEEGTASGDVSPERIADALAEVAAYLPVRSWLVPLGIGHEDHRIVADAGLRFARRRMDRSSIYCYYELPYYAERPSETAAAVEVLALQGFRLGHDEALSHSRNRALKLAALSRYASQRSLLGRRLLRSCWHRERVLRLVALADGARP
jgi:LmbE family N-acetylglucosaminyl deacetylase